MPWRVGGTRLEVHVYGPLPFKGGLRVSYWFVFIIAFCRWSGGVCLADVHSEKSLSGPEIFDAALAKFESDRGALRQWQYHQTLTTHQLDAAGKILAKETWQSIVRPGNPEPPEYTAKSV